MINRTTVTYWDSFYSAESPPASPSQFAAFVLGETLGDVIDLGCGNGRDSIFFANHGRRVLCVDGSREALTRIEEGIGLPTLHCNFENPKFVESLLPAISHFEHERVFYARFLLHALAPSARKNLMGSLRHLLRKGDVACFEYRTSVDDFLPKQTEDHYRKGLSSREIMDLVALSGASPAYLVEGFGMAKYGVDDAHVGRLLLRRGMD